MRILLTLLCFPIAATAQQLGDASGAVSGSVVCSDTHKPARFATVTLQPVQEAAAVMPASGTPNQALKQVQTRLDGSFAISDIPPGQYYVVVQFTGYLSPVSQFTRAEISHLTPAGRELLVGTLPTITVEPKLVTSGRQLTAGSFNFGTLRFEDGTPIPRIAVTLYKRVGTENGVPFPAHTQ